MCWFVTALHVDIAVTGYIWPRRSKCLTCITPEKNIGMPTGDLNLQKSDGATVDHIVSEDEGGYDTLDNLVACCVVCNSSKGNGRRNLLPQCTDKKWDGGCSLFLTLAPMYRQHLSREDEKWLKALRRVGMAPDEENIQARINDLQLGI